MSALGLREVVANIRGLELPTRDLLVCGSGPMLAHGLIESVGDVDLVAWGAAWAEACRRGAVAVAPSGDRRVRLGAVDVFDGWLGFDLAGLIARAEWRYGLQWAGLADVLAYKLYLNRPKDQEHLRLLAAHAGTSSHAALPDPPPGG